MSDEPQISKALQAYVDDGALAGAATLVWRNGKTVATCVGWRDVEAQAPIERGTLFRIASMTKPITTTAALMLLEEGRFELSDPVSRWAPEFSQMSVLRSPTGALDEVVSAMRQITFEDLLTQKSGLTYGAFFPGALEDAYAAALGGDIDSDVQPDDWIARLAKLPLIDQPGTTLHYGHSTDLLGLLIARIEDAPLGDVLQRRIFGRLGMRDTAFTVPPDKAARCAALYGFDEAGLLKRRLTGPSGSTMAERPEGMAYVSGGQGLWSTLDDYLVFARMFVSEGVVEGVRLLHPETLSLMTTNRLTVRQRESAEVGGMTLFARGHGFGMGVAVVLEPKEAAPTLCGGNMGSVGWPGGFGGWWRADRLDNSIMIFLAHNIVERHQFAQGVGFGVYGAITEFQSLAARH